MNKILKIIEYPFSVLSLMLYTGGPLTVILSGGASEGESGGGDDADNSLIKIVFLFIYLITFILLSFRWKKVVYVLSKDNYIILLLGIVTASILWSINSEITISRCIAIVGTSLFGIYLASRYTLKEQVVLLGWTFTVITLLSLLFIVALPKFGIMGGIHAGAFRGIYTHKNVLGRMMIMSIIVNLLRINLDKNRSIIYVTLSLSMLLLLFCRSSAALLNFFNVIMIFLIFRTWRWHYEMMIPFSIGMITLIICGVIWFNENSAILFSAIGKDASLTGRTELWPIILNMIWNRPFFGYGYGAFWVDTDNLTNVWFMAGWEAPNGHNGILDLCLNAGLIGVIFFMLSLWKTLRNSFILLRYSTSSEGFWPLIFIVCLVLSNLTETALMVQNDILWVLYVAIAYSVLIPEEEEIEAANDLITVPQIY
ncbi:O-antigen ligase [Dolichospermum sp. UHCC 0259]|uniref:O-antigen ligase family protein n=1 Tax=Dolichospermum sp. UHCC 0259 TaxID=2590010 RepID=UPI00144882C0|nr:O-antigen ligase family protein [Dolichospermum sp. UHCC 0259]MTJ48422.1 O-antigen ligase family protein [Dolichospermum sp. UHCC 0259]